MKTGIFVHSKTGNTYAIAQKLKDRFLLKRHLVSLEKITAEDDGQPVADKVVLVSAPDVQGYDFLIFGAPVRAFSLSAVMAAYLSELETLEGVKVFCYVTQSLPFPWMGGNRAVRQMKEILSAKGAEILGSGVVNWSGRNREYMISALVEKAASAI
jgi:NAD(P)H dehydrogenase (quinone)